MANWKVVALVNGDIEAVSDPAAKGRPGAHEWIVWEGAAEDKAEALKCAEKVDPRVDLEWMRIRYEMDLAYGRFPLSPSGPAVHSTQYHSPRAPFASGMSARGTRLQLPG
jgi:hypothetical protein